MTFFKYPTDLSPYNLSSHTNPFSSQALPPLETLLPLSKLSAPSKVSSSSDFSSNSSLTVRSPNVSPIPMKSPLGMGSQSIFCNNFIRRPRGEKRPIPEEQKDEKYFERRKRNNEAAKKSRDARKMREDRVRLSFHFNLHIFLFRYFICRPFEAYKAFDVTLKMFLK